MLTHDSRWKRMNGDSKIRYIIFGTFDTQIQWANVGYDFLGNSIKNCLQPFWCSTARNAINEQNMFVWFKGGTEI